VLDIMDKMQVKAKGRAVFKQNKDEMKSAKLRK
jgi:hypothetical protein